MTSMMQPSDAPSTGPDIVGQVAKSAGKDAGGDDRRRGGNAMH